MSLTLSSRWLCVLLLLANPSSTLCACHRLLDVEAEDSKLSLVFEFMEKDLKK